ncbi:MAG: helix-turn-helix domain-containing protein [Pseudomonadales bacterium]|nr:helix-turn-helix domain-containing protein [Pseudomonadales bacterium]
MNAAVPAPVIERLPAIPTRRSFLKHCTKPVIKAARDKGLKSSVTDTLLAFASFAYTYSTAYPSITTIARKRGLNKRTVRRHRELIEATGLMTVAARTAAMRYSSKHRDTTNGYQFNIDGFITKAMLDDAVNTDNNALPDRTNCPPVRVPRVTALNITTTATITNDNDFIDFDECLNVEPITGCAGKDQETKAAPLRGNLSSTDETAGINQNVVATAPVDNNPRAQSKHHVNKPTHKQLFAAITAMTEDRTIRDSVVGRIAKLWRISGLSEPVMTEIMANALRSKDSDRDVMSYVTAAINQRSGNYALTGINADGVCYDNLNRLRRVVETRKERSLPDSTIQEWAQSVMLVGRSLLDQAYVVDYAIAEGWEMIHFIGNEF